MFLGGLSQIGLLASVGFGSFFIFSIWKDGVRVFYYRVPFLLSTQLLY